jgi:hypothetical protein
MGFFWDLINSQVNFIYLPLMSVNPPGQVSFYLDVLIFFVTFDPIPMDIVYDIIPIWHFDQVTESNSKPVFSRIGMEDRNVLDVLGSLFLFMVIFFVMQVIYYSLIGCVKYSARIRKIVKVVTIESAYRTLFIIFFTETYMDLLLGGLLNSENFHLL